MGETDEPPRPQVRVLTPPVESHPVAPAPESPLAAVRRDCGISVALPAGGALWLYCDTATFGPEGRLAWFENTSAAVASDAEPLVMLERTDPRGHAAPFLEPAAYPTCEGGQGRFTWPTAAVLVDRASEPADTPTDPVVAVFYENVCLVAGGPDGQDAGVATFEVPSTAVPTGSLEGWEPAGFLTGRLANDRLFPRPPDDQAGDEHPFGQAAVRAGEHVYAYRCPNTDGACTVARAPATLDAVADPDAWAGWDGEGWTAALDTATPMDQPDAAGPDPVRVVKPSVGWVDDLDLYVQVAHVWGKSHLITLRVAADPWGPWSEPAEVRLPGCEGRYPDVCFAVEVHPHLSTADAVAITWYDPAVAIGGPSPTRYAELPIAVS